MYILIPKIAAPLAEVRGSILRARDKTHILYLQHILLRNSIAFVQRQGKSKSRSEGQGDKEARQHDRLNSSSVFAAKSWSRRVSTLVDTGSSNAAHTNHEHKNK